MYEDYLRTVLRIEVKQAPKPAPEPALDHATYSGPADPDGASTLRSQAAANAANAAGRAPQGTEGAAGASVRTFRKSESGDPYANVGRNDPCPCGSGKKFKNCHGKDR